MLRNVEQDVSEFFAWPGAWKHDALERLTYCHYKWDDGQKLEAAMACQAARKPDVSQQHETKSNNKYHKKWVVRK